MTMSSANGVELTAQQERDKVGKRHALKDAMAWSTLRLGFAVTVVGVIATRIVA